MTCCGGLGRTLFVLHPCWKVTRRRSCELCEVFSIHMVGKKVKPYRALRGSHSGPSYLASTCLNRRVAMSQRLQRHLQCLVEASFH